MSRRKKEPKTPGITESGAVLAAVSDLHCGSTVGLCGPEDVALDDGAFYRPSAAQQWLWSNWTDYWERVQRARRGRPLLLLLNGDLVDGDHHGTAQIVSRHPGQQFEILLRCLRVPLDLKPSAIIVVRGTESHVGKLAAVEEAAAKFLASHGAPVVRCPDTGGFSWWYFLGQIGPVLLSASHHGRMGQRPWTRMNVVANLAAQIFYEYAARGERHPDIAIRSHLHQHADTHDAHPVRLIQLPAWQLATSFVHKVAADSLADIGGIMVDIPASGGWSIAKHVYAPERPSTWSYTWQA